MTAEQEATLRKELYQMLVTADDTKHDISKYRIDFPTLDSIWSKVRNNEGFVAYQTRTRVNLRTTRDTNDKILTVALWDFEVGDYIGRYQRVQDCINEVKSQITHDMIEVEKVLLIHEYVVQKTIYKDQGNISSMGGGPLGEGIGICEGYANAMLILLRAVGISCYFIYSLTMNHGWVLAKVDNEWYHIDPTWDDTVGNNFGKGNKSCHRFFMKNSKEFLDDEKKHYDWKLKDTDENLVSTSTKYSTTFVHDVIGIMYYETGFWYYIDPKTKSIARSTISGDKFREIVKNDGLKTFELQSVKESMLTYIEDGVTKTMSVKQEDLDSQLIEPINPGESETSEGIPDFVRTDYVYVPSGATFDMGYVPNLSSTIEITFELVQSGRYGSILVAYTSTSHQIQIRQEAKTGIYAAYGWYNSKVYNTKVGEKILLSQIDNKTYINGNLARTATKQRLQIKNPCIINATYTKIYGFTIKEKDAVIHDYIPYCDKKGTACFYDRITKQLIYAR